MTLGLDGLTLHPVQVFSYEAVKERAGTLGQPESAARIETMAWLLEIAAQMADELGARFVLHGGTTAQLHLKSAQQRGSADVDGLFTGTLEEVEGAVARIGVRFAAIAPFLQFERMSRKHPPPDQFAAWSCRIPANHGGRVQPDGLASRQVKLEIALLTGEVPSELATGSVFGLKMSSGVAILTKGALIGDKLLMLAVNTTGIELPEYPAPADRHLERLARQMYDIDHLSGTALSKVEIADAAYMADYFAPLEGAMRGVQRVTASMALKDAREFACEWGLMPLPIGRKEWVAAAKRWQGGNVGRPLRLETPGWALRGLRVASTIRIVEAAVSDSAKGAVRFQKDITSLLDAGIKHPEIGTIAASTLLDEDRKICEPALKRGRREWVTLLALHRLGPEAFRSALQ